MMMPMVLILLFSNSSSLSLFGGLDGGLNAVQLSHFSNVLTSLLQVSINGCWLHVPTKLNQGNKTPVWHIKDKLVGHGTGQGKNCGFMVQGLSNVINNFVIQKDNQIVRRQFEFVGFHCVFPLLDVSSLVVVALPVHTVPVVPESYCQYISEKFGLVVDHQLSVQATDQKDLTLFSP
jgi:hypothetical protein